MTIKPRSTPKSKHHLIRLFIIVICFALLFPNPGYAATRAETNAAPVSLPDTFAHRTVMVHLFEWKWTDIARECENFLGPMGFAAVQVSPPTEHAWLQVGGTYPWYLRYQPVSYKLQSRSGTEAEFQDMVSRCYAAHVDVYVDAVINHMTGVADTDNGGEIGYPGTSPDGTTYYPYYNPSNPTQDGARLFYPFIDPENPSNDYWGDYVYNYDDFHYCGSYPNQGAKTNDIDADPVEVDGDPTDYENNEWNVRHCELVNLADLKTETEKVQNRIIDYLNRLVAMGVAGFRIDAAKHMYPVDIETIIDNVDNRPLSYGGRKPYFFQEVIDRNGTEVISKYEYNGYGDVTEFKYEGDVTYHFVTGDIKTLGNPVQIGEQWDLLPSTDAVVFIVNHDDQHDAAYLTYEDGATFKNANIFMLAWPYGYPSILSSYAFDDKDQGPPADANGNTDELYGLIGNPDCLTESQSASADSGWVCEHRWLAIAGMVAFRNVTDGQPITNWWDGGSAHPDQIAFGRGNQGWVAINNESGTLSIAGRTTQLADGTYCDVIHGERGRLGLTCSGPTIQVKNGKIVSGVVNGFDAVAIHANSKLRR